MNARETISIIVILCAITTISVVTVSVLRWIARKTGSENVVKEGAILAASGVVVPGFLNVAKCNIPYSDIRSVEPLSGWESMRFLFAISVQRLGRWGPDPVLIELKSPPQFYQYAIVAPKNRADFIEKIREQIGRYNKERE